ncbi:MAG: sugar transferase [Pseudomonadota bacterium]
MLSQQFFVIANFLMLLDGVICIFAGYMAYYMSLEIRSGGLVMAWNDFIGLVLFVMFANNYLMGKFGFYSEKRFPSYWAIMKALTFAVTLDFITLSMAAFLIGVRPFSRVFAIAYFLMALLLFIITRFILYYYLDKRASTTFNTRQILLVGTGERLEVIVEALERQRSWGHRIAGCINIDGQCNANVMDIPVLGNLDDFEQVLQKSQIDEVIFALPSSFPIPLEKYLDKCEEIGIAYRIVPGLFDFSNPSIKVETLQGIPTITAYSGTATASGLLYKRILDLIVGFIGSLIFVILYPIVGLVIKLDSPGPILFRQLRVGQNNRLFTLFKFRSMTAEAEKQQSELLRESEMSGPMFKMEDDPRLTRVGRFLRKTSLDEIPQFINILKGEMSLVGTRPPTPNEVKQYENWHRRRISAKPGLTGLWQISGRSQITDFVEVVKLDLKYIDNWRFLNDLIILWKTIWVVLARKGAK